jgi:Ras-specific guanine nucleotide-releasing factor RalGPS
MNCVQAASPLQQNESLHQSRHLLDDSVLEDSKQQQLLQLSDNGSSGSSDDIMGFETDGEPVITNEVYSVFQGCLRRKTVLKDRRKPAVASWQRYWVQIWANSLVYFAPKSFKG